MSSSSPQLSGVDFLHKGYRYWLARQGESDVFWYCCKRTAGCPARLFTSLKNDRVVEEMHCHDHPPMESMSTNGIVPSTKGSSGGPALAKSGLRHNGYDFHQERTSENGTKAYWVCKQKRSMQCAARVHTLTESGEVVHEFGEHNHAPVGDDGTAKASPEPTSEHDPYDSPVASPRSSAQARPAMCHKGYTYWQHSASSDGTRRLLYCKERRSKQCTARLNATATGKVVQVVGQHNHPPSGPVKPSAKEV
ncbi:zinc finger protein [Aphelenchoides avenae]|nr:zinc finger protein [Aphelenchus avenae]